MDLQELLLVLSTSSSKVTDTWGVAGQLVRVFTRVDGV